MDDYLGKWNLILSHYINLELIILHKILNFVFFIISNNKCFTSQLIEFNCLNGLEKLDRYIYGLINNCSMR